MELHVFVTSSDGASLSDLRPMPVELSSAREASLRCMATLHSVKAAYLQARLLDGAEILCDSGLVPLGSEDWFCLSSQAPSGSDDIFNSRLMSYMTEDLPGGWVLCFDLREQCDTVSVLTFVRVLKVTPSVPQQTAPCEALDAGADKSTDTREVDASTVRDCSELDNLGVHPTQNRLLHMFRQPSAEMLTAAFWNSMACGGVAASGLAPKLAGSLGLCDEDVRKSQAEMGGGGGYGRFRGLPWADLGVPLSALSDTVDSLQKRGFPPVFIFMYDQAWLLLAHAFEVASSLLQSKDLHMSLSILGFALQPGEVNGNRVGSNFGQPHRDQPHRDCHTPDGQLTMVTTWIPLVPATEQNGCMYVVPADRDPLFEKHDDPNYMHPSHELVGPFGVSQPCEAGEVLTWRADLVHYGSDCAPNVEQPRKSVSTMFMLSSCGKASTVSLAELCDSWGLDVRLKVICRTLLHHQPLHPNFDGLSLAQE